MIEFVIATRRVLDLRIKFWRDDDLLIIHPRTKRAILLWSDWCYLRPSSLRTFFGRVNVKRLMLVHEYYAIQKARFAFKRHFLANTGTVT